MIIIKQGKMIKTLKYRATCRKCDAILSIGENEFGVMPDSNKNQFYAVRCPCCGSTLLKHNCSLEE
jgi:RNase P subunit RPR2